MTKKKIEEYFAAVTSPYETAPQAGNLNWNSSVSPEAALERQALAFGLDNRPPTPDMYQQAVALDQAPTPAPDMYQQAVDLDPTKVPAATVAQAPSAGGWDGVIKAFEPVLVDLTKSSGFGTSAPQEAVANVLRDPAGNPVLSGNGGTIGIPNQTTGNTPSPGSAAGGGKGGSANEGGGNGGGGNAPQSAVSSGQGGK